jgi:membrane protein DedA with SNARE-associated domain
MGVILGCSTSYAIGRALGPRFRNSRFAANRRDLLARAEGLFARFGALALFVAYSGPMRGAVPFAAGLAPLPFLRFQAINIASAAAWIGATMSPGALLWRMSV